ncbi:LOW QUALITY PROTEIN: hypothetical protein V2J09_002129 [Rumex salicifolius]
MAGKLMRAVQYSGYDGGAASLKHVEVAVPDTKADEVLLKLEATSLNPVDWKILKGVLRPFFPGKFPAIPGTDVAGKIVQVGSGVSKFKAGDKVVAKESLTVIRQHLKPTSCRLDSSSSPNSSLWSNILITAVSGSVGIYAIQLAKLGNAHVTTTCGARNMEFVKGLGADEVLDYKTPESLAKVPKTATVARL